MSDRLARRVAGFGTSIFSEITALAVQYGAVNLGQGFPDFAGPEFVKQAASARGGAVETTVWCQGSLQKRCGRMECMTELTPFRLWPVLHGILHQWESNRASA